jgi:hypothetical protein
VNQQTRFQLSGYAHAGPAGTRTIATAFRDRALKLTPPLHQALAQADEQSAELAAALGGEALDQVVMLSPGDLILSPLSFDQIISHGKHLTLLD